MRIGVMVDTEQPFDLVIEQFIGLRDAGIDTAWASQIFAYDALTVLAVAGREAPGIELGTAVVPTYPRHPVMLAGQALTVQAATGGRLTLGVGLSHQMVIEHVFGESFDRAGPAHEGVPVDPDPTAPRRAGRLRRRDAEGLDLRSSGDRGDCPSGPGGGHGHRHVGHRRPNGLGHGHLPDGSGHHRAPHRPDHPEGSCRGGPAGAGHRGVACRSA